MTVFAGVGLTAAVAAAVVGAVRSGVGATVHSVSVIYCKWLNALRIKFMIS